MSQLIAKVYRQAEVEYRACIVHRGDSGDAECEYCQVFLHTFHSEQDALTAANAVIASLSTQRSINRSQKAGQSESRT